MPIENKNELVIIMMQSKIKLSLISIMILCLSACSSNPNKHPLDPYESVNRGVYKFNRTVDKYAVKPVAYTYKKFTPSPVRSGVNNFFSNIGEVTTISNDLLQFKFKYVAHDLARFAINSTVGLLGVFDVAGELGLDRRKEDFGQTLYTWGYSKSNYLVLPFLGPSTFRDTFGLAVDYFALSLWPWIETNDDRLLLLAANLIDTRAELLHKETVLDTIAVDEYSLIRDAFLQNRRFLSTDGQSDFQEGEDPLDDFFEDDDQGEDEEAKEIGDEEEE